MRSAEGQIWPVNDSGDDCEPGTLCSYAETMKLDVSKMAVWLKKDGLEDKEAALLLCGPPDHILRGCDVTYSEEEIKNAWVKVSYTFPCSTLL